MNDPPNDQDRESLRTSAANGTAATNRKLRAKSIGEVASPLLAGFSFTNVILIAMSSDTDNFLLPGIAMISWTVATVAFIATVQFAKYVKEAGEGATVTAYEWLTDISYHLGIVAFLGGFGLALAPQHSTGSYVLRWAAAIVAFTAGATELVLYVDRLIRKKPHGQ